ncbi:TPA: hypothetical protein ACWV7F_004477 [Salmonella enterica subsp. enterica serovar Muenchen]|nr:hypothetical protein [Salmonella enterica subsp. enterica serovar Muenchen]
MKNKSMLKMTEIYTAQEFKKLTRLNLFHRRCNHLIKLDILLDSYSSDLPEKEKASILVEICNICKLFLDRKPLSGRAVTVHNLKTQAQEQLLSIMKEIVSESNTSGIIGWKRVKAALTPIIHGANTKTKCLDEEYWAEAITNRHFAKRNIACSADPFELWKQSDTKTNYVDWLRECYIQLMLKNGQEKELVTRFFSNVKYMNHEEREHYSIYISRGKFYNRNGMEFSTLNMESDRAGKGWGIYVRDAKNKIYINKHQRNVFHHSSFLAGGPILSAGELSINNGILVGITNKSGHYKPDDENFLDMLAYLKTRGVNLCNVAACMKTTGCVQEFYNAEDIFINRSIVNSRLVSKPCL